MSTVANNRISVVIDPAVMNQIREAFQKLNAYMPFLIGLNVDERVSLPKMNNVNRPFVTDAFYAIQNNPALFPNYLSATELNKDLALFNQLDELLTLSQQLTEKMRDTQILAGSEAYTASLMIYRLLEAASIAGMPGTDTLYEQLAERFAGQGNKGTTIPINPSPTNI